MLKSKKEEVELFGKKTEEETIEEETQEEEEEEEEETVVKKAKKQNVSVENNIPEWAKTPDVIVEKGDEANFFPKVTSSRVIDDGESRVNKEWMHA